MDTEIIKSKSDSRIYKTFKLENQLQCLIVSDPQAQKSSAALSVGIGSLKDPMEAQGLAHYLQHMLFMGTEKYPDENEYSNFITKNSGSNNAYTSQEQTNYQLEVASNVFQQTLDKFAQFFIAPLMNESSSERQLNAVHSQHSKNLQNDAWRKFQLSKHISKEGHPYNKFSTGDKTTLANPNLRKMLLDFYNSNYSANLMKLTVYSNEKPETLAEWIKKMFSEIPNRKYERFQMKEIPYDNKSLGKIFKIVPVKDKKCLQLCWILNLKKEHYRNHPGKYVSHLVGHEGKGSLLSFLTKEGLATGLSSYYDDEYSCFTEMDISIDLTEKGIQHTKEIIEYTLYYIEMLKEVGPQQWIFEEIKSINKMKFDYMQKKKSMMHTARMAKNMQDRKINEILVHPYLMEEWKPEIIKQFISEMKTDNLYVFLQAKEFESQCNLTQPVYKTKYSQEEFGNVCAKKCDVSLPEKNHFIPKNFDILPMGEQTIPSKLYESDYISSYFKKDHRFQLPKVSLSMRLFYDGAFTVENQICRTLYKDMMKEDLRQFVYLAEVAEIDSSFNFTSYYGADINVSGFRDSTISFVEPYLNKILDYTPNDDQLFKTMKEKLKRKYNNHFLDDPYRLCYDSQVRCLRDTSQVSPLQKLNQIDKITLEDVLKFAQKWKRRIFVESLLTGNIEKETSLNFMKSIESLVSKKCQILPISQIGNIRSISLPEKKIIGVQKQLKSKDQVNSSFLVHFQGQNHSIRENLLLKLCQLMAKEPSFDYLRTKQQLGYIVFCLSDDNRGVGGLTFLVQSSIKTSYQILSYFNHFLNQILKEILEKVDEKTLNEYTSSMKIAKQEKDKNLSEESKRFWSEITKHQNVFNRKEIQIQEISTIKLQEFKKFANDLLYDHPKRFQMHITSHRQDEANEKIKEERLKNENYEVYKVEEEFRRQMPLYPDFYAKKC